MEENTALSIASLIIALAASVFAGLTWWNAWRSSKDAARSADAAERSAAAAESSSQHQAELARVSRQAHHSRYQFQARRRKSDELWWVLTMAEDAPRAHNLRVTSDLGIDGGETEFEVFEPGQTAELRIPEALVTPGHLHITFEDFDGDNAETLRRSLRLRPPQRLISMGY